RAGGDAARPRDGAPGPHHHAAARRGRRAGARRARRPLVARARGRASGAGEPVAGAVSHRREPAPSDRASSRRRARVHGEGGAACSGLISEKNGAWREAVPSLRTFAGSDRTTFSSSTSISPCVSTFTVT